MKPALEYLGEIVQHACLRPRMYVGDPGDFSDIELFLNSIDIGLAIAEGKRGAHLPSHYMTQFYDYLKLHVMPEDDSWSWSHIIEATAEKCGVTPFVALSDTFSEFVDSRKPALQRLAEVAE